MAYYNLATLVKDAVEKRYKFIIGARGSGKMAYFELCAKAFLIARLIEILKNIKKDEG